MKGWCYERCESRETVRSMSQKPWRRKAKHGESGRLPRGDIRRRDREERQKLWEGHWEPRRGTQKWTEGRHSTALFFVFFILSSKAAIRRVQGLNMLLNWWVVSYCVKQQRQPYTPVTMGNTWACVYSREAVATPTKTYTWHFQKRVPNSFYNGLPLRI